MNEHKLEALLVDLVAGRRDVADALAQLRNYTEIALPDATLDTNRALRQGRGEVVFGEGKDADQIVRIIEALLPTEQPVLVTRVDQAKAQAVRSQLPAVTYHAEARALLAGAEKLPPVLPGRVAVITAGTSDRPVAEEVLITGRVLGLNTEAHFDIGVAGLHRLLSRLPQFRDADVIIVVAGMEGALPSVIGGLVDKPVIAVPASVGYGVGAGGFTALTGMLSSCASGLTVVNIDNGFGAAFAAYRILRAYAAAD
jgi:pyridinium-3,5-biscarboxylic acid mononucleotide synthase